MLVLWRWITLLEDVFILQLPPWALKDCKNICQNRHHWEVFRVCDIVGKLLQTTFPLKQRKYWIRIFKIIENWDGNKERYLPTQRSKIKWKQECSYVSRHVVGLHPGAGTSYEDLRKLLFWHLHWVQGEKARAYPRSDSNKRPCGKRGYQRFLSLCRSTRNKPTSHMETARGMLPAWLWVEGRKIQL